MPSSIFDVMRERKLHMVVSLFSRYFLSYIRGKDKHITNYNSEWNIRSPRMTQPNDKVILSKREITSN